MVMGISKFAFSQTDTLKPYQIERIDVTAEYRGMKVIQTPYSIGILDSMDFRRNTGIHLTSSINLIPGVRLEMRTPTSGTRLVIRGYGNQTNFNGIGFKAYLNGISLTDADGTTTFDDIDFTTLGKVEVIKGPASSLFGTNIGGVVNMQTEKSPQGVSVRQDFIGGKYGMWRTNTFAGIGTEKSNLLINYGHQNYDGFRSHSNSTKDFVTINGDVITDSKGKLNYYFNYTNSRDYLAGEQDSAGFINEYGTADPSYLANDAHIFIESERAGLSYEYKFADKLSNISSVFAGGYTLDQPFAAGLNRTNKTRFGGRTEFNFSSNIAELPFKILFGAEFLKNVNFAKSYALANNVQGNLRSDLEVRPSSYFTFVQADIDITRTTNILAGMSLNFLEYMIKDMIPSTSTYVNASGYKKFDAVVTPRFAIRQMLTSDISLYASYSEGYQPPQTNQVVISQTGVVNYDLKPEHAYSFEAGSKGSVLDHKLNYEVAFFNMDVSDKLVPENFPGYTAYVNAGKVRFTGVETMVSYNLYLPKSPVSLIRPFVSYTYSHFRNKDFKSDNNNNAQTVDFTDKSVVGIPDHSVNAGIDFETTFGMYLYSTFTFTDKIPLNNINTSYADSYTLLNLKAGYKKILLNNLMLDVFVGSDNVYNTKYASMLFVNARDQRYYLAGSPTTYYGGASLRYTIK